MLELHSTLTPSLVLHFIIISIIALIIQSVNYAILIKRDRIKLFEVLLAIHLLIISVIFRKLNDNIVMSEISSNAYNTLRYIVALLIIILGIYNILKEEKYFIIPAIILTVISLPIMEGLPYGMWTVLLISSVILLTLRATLLCSSYIKRQKTEITGNSIKEAFDTQYNGILFAEKNGSILLANKQMIRLIKDITGENSRNAKKIWEIIDEKGRIQKVNNKIWRFYKDEIELKGKTIFQITTTDITEQENINKQLADYEEQLRLQQIELKRALDNLDELGKKEAISKSWEYIHGVLGQRISFFQRILNEDSNCSLEEIKELIHELQEDLTKIKEENLEEIYGGIVSSYESLGIKIHKKGELPEDKQVSRLFVETIREGSNNAIRHGEASNIYLSISTKDNYKLRITNDGKTPHEDIIWGGGLQSIDKKVKTLGGDFRVTTRPEFTLEIEVAK